MYIDNCVLLYVIVATTWNSFLKYHSYILATINHHIFILASARRLLASYICLNTQLMYTYAENICNIIMYVSIYRSIYVHIIYSNVPNSYHINKYYQEYIIEKRAQEKLNIYPYVNGITHTNGARLINVHERIAIVT